MTAIIITFSILLAAISIGGQIIISKTKLVSFCSNDNENLRSYKTKICAIILLAINLYNLIQKVIVLTKEYTSDWVVWDAEEALGRVFEHIFAILIIITYISLGIFLLKRLQTLAITSLASIIIFSIFDSIFVRTSDIFYCYLQLLPTTLVLGSFLFILLTINKKIKVDYYFQKIIVFSPLLFLLKLIYSRRIPLRHIIERYLLYITIILEIIVFLIIFNELIKNIQRQGNNYGKSMIISKRQTIILIVSILILPSIIALLSSIEKLWLFIALIILAIAIPIVIAATVNSSIRTRIIAITCTLSLVVGFCFLVKFLPNNPDNTEEFDPYMCHWCGGNGIYITEEGKTRICSHCNGSGER